MVKCDKTEEERWLDRLDLESDMRGVTDRRSGEMKNELVVSNTWLKKTSQIWISPGNRYRNHT